MDLFYRSEKEKMEGGEPHERGGQEKKIEGVGGRKTIAIRDLKGRWPDVVERCREEGGSGGVAGGVLGRGGGVGHKR